MQTRTMGFVLMGLAAVAALSLAYFPPAQQAAISPHQPMAEEDCTSFMLDYYQRYETSRPSQGESELWEECVWEYATSMKIASDGEWRRAPMSEEDCGEYVLRHERNILANEPNGTSNVLMAIRCARSYRSVELIQSRFIQENYPD